MHFCDIYVIDNLFIFRFIMSTQGPQLPPFLPLERKPEHVLRIQTEPRLPSPRKRRSDKMKSILLFMMASAIMGMVIPAGLGVDMISLIWNSIRSSPVPTEVHKD